ncbi:MAG TPA: hypothetical protein PLY89_04740, partial [Synergistaceae bacterium]|nr:hypothetical protein [Synergistaceae bacterium]
MALKLEWYEIRDVLLGHNSRSKNLQRALELASTCQHPDAQWLVELFAGKDVEEAREVFLSQEHDDRA